ncbi:MAG: DNA polymerase III subunit chi [Alphaproteobacteria bacterium]|nr:DNA polymerase III subunit chi [Alphaproteobacteria bacterium]
MNEVRFYHFKKQSLEQVLPALLSKALDSGRRIVVKAPNQAEVERLSDHLWTYHPDGFLPHGSEKDGDSERQPIWITSKDENPNKAKVLILVQGTTSAIQDQFDLCCEMLNGQNNQDVAAARDRWKLYKEAGYNLTYWQQSSNGWEKKNI